MLINKIDKIINEWDFFLSSLAISYIGQESKGKIIYGNNQIVKVAQKKIDKLKVQYDLYCNENMCFATIWSF